MFSGRRVSSGLALPHPNPFGIPGSASLEELPCPSSSLALPLPSGRFFIVRIFHGKISLSSSEVAIGEATVPLTFCWFRFRCPVCYWNWTVSAFYKLVLWEFFGSRVLCNLVHFQSVCHWSVPYVSNDNPSTCVDIYIYFFFFCMKTLVSLGSLWVLLISCHSANGN